MQLGVPDDQSVLDQPVSDEQAQSIQAITQARIETRKPMAYLLGRARYLGIDFLLEDGIVVPRSPIGPLLVQGGLENWQPNRVNRVLDLCSGSGCLGIVAAEYFDATDVALFELDDAALALSQRNIAALHLQDRVSAYQVDVMADWPDLPPFDLILANPPYVDAPDMRTLPPEYQHEPVTGLASGSDGLDHSRARSKRTSCSVVNFRNVPGSKKATT